MNGSGKALGTRCPTRAGVDIRLLSATQTVLILSDDSQ